MFNSITSYIKNNIRTLGISSMHDSNRVGNGYKWETPAPLIKRDEETF